MRFSSPTIIFGAGNLGRRVAKLLHPVLFCDNNPASWSKDCEGVLVESPKTAVERYPHATFVVAIWHPSRTEKMMDRIDQLKSLGVKTENIISFPALFNDHGNFLLPHMFWERADYYTARREEIRSARALMDAEGREEFDRQMRLRLGDVSAQLIDSGIQYFPKDLFRLGENEVFIDCGAFDGDTVAEFRRATGDHFSHLIAFEPDPMNFAALRSAVNGDSRITLQPYAAGVRRETVRFTLSGTGSRVSSAGTCEVQTVTLDEALQGVTPTYMKFDIEGSEPDALEGGRETIRRHRPKLAVCLYHAPDHLWSIPFRLNELLPNSRLTLRTYCADGWDCVCYCVPR
jgi:FkbM family methyltransferase